MDERRGAEGIEHLQAAAREMLAAARSFLDVVEDVVEDPERLSAAASSVVDLVRGGVASATRPTSPLQPWEQAAWGSGGSPDDDLHDDDLHDDDLFDGDVLEDEAAEVDGPVGETIDLDALAASDDDEDPSSGVGAAPQDAPSAPRRRVRRIAVD
jgi:hypothetical protein